MAQIVQPTGDLNFTRFAELLEAEAGLDAGDGRRVLQAALDILARHVAAGFRVRLTNFGSFVAKTVKVPQGGLPFRREAGVSIPEEIRKVKFTATGIFADVVKSEGPVGSLRKRGKGFADADAA